MVSVCGASQAGADPQPIGANRLVAGMSDLIDRRSAKSSRSRRTKRRALTDGGMLGLESAILNLAINARDAMPSMTPSKQVTPLDERYCETADGAKPGQYVMISVTDTGAGMSADVIDKAFEPFFTTKPEFRAQGWASVSYGFVRQTSRHIGSTAKSGKARRLIIFPSLRANPLRQMEAISRLEVRIVLVVEDDRMFSPTSPKRWLR